jgi:ribosome-binding protein aMBF1 (putative translation factor)
MLPDRDHPDFPAELRKARLAKGLNMKQLAAAIGIDGAMIGRYEDPNHSWHSKPSKKTWDLLNTFLFSSNPPTDADLTNTSASMSSKSLKSMTPLGEASIEEIVSELKKRGATVDIRFT